MEKKRKSQSFWGWRMLAGVFVLLVGACSTLPGADFLNASDVNYAAGTPLGERLQNRDRAALGDSFVAAMRTGERQSWRGRRGTSGEIRPRGFMVANLRAHPDELIPARSGDLDFNYILETDLGQYVLTRNSNIRRGPGTNRPIAEVLPSGTGVDVIGKVDGQNWMLIAADGALRGYVFGNLLIKAPGTELELVGGPRRRPILCRAFSQTMTVSGQQASWRGTACNDGLGWRLHNEPPGPEQLADDELLGL